MKNQFQYIAIFTFIVFLSLGLKCTEKPKKPSEVLFYLTKPDKSALFEKQESGISVATNQSLPAIEVNIDKAFQEMDGFGFTLTGGSAFHIKNMSKEKRHQLLTELFVSGSEGTFVLEK